MLFIQTHQVSSGVELRNEPHALLPAVLNSGDRSCVRSLPELGREAAQADVVASLVTIRANSCCLQHCQKAGKQLS